MKRSVAATCIRLDTMPSLARLRQAHKEESGTKVDGFAFVRSRVDTMYRERYVVLSVLGNLTLTCYSLREQYIPPFWLDDLKFANVLQKIYRALRTSLVPGLL